MVSFAVYRQAKAFLTMAKLVSIYLCSLIYLNDIFINLGKNIFLTINSTFTKIDPKNELFENIVKLLLYV